MFEKVLFPTDFSERADILLDCVACIPEVREVVLAHVVKETRYPKGARVADRLSQENAKPLLAQAQRYLRTVNPEITVSLTTRIAPDLAEGILAAAEESGAGLMVLAAREKGPLAGMLSGSVPPAVLCRPGKTAVLFMRHRIVEGLSGKTFEKFCPLLFSRILCPTDFSPYSDRAIALAGGLTGVGEVLLLHVVPRLGSGSEMREAEGNAKARIAKAREGLEARGVRCRDIITTGDPAAGIVQAAEIHDVSAIWISSYGKGCLHALIAGSTVQEVAMKAKRPVIVIRSAE